MIDLKRRLTAGVIRYTVRRGAECNPNLDQYLMGDEMVERYARSSIFYS